MIKQYENRRNTVMAGKLEIVIEYRAVSL